MTTHFESEPDISFTVIDESPWQAGVRAKAIAERVFQGFDVIITRPYAAIPVRRMQDGSVLKWEWPFVAHCGEVSE